MCANRSLIRPMYDAHMFQRCLFCGFTFANDKEFSAHKCEALPRQKYKGQNHALQRQSNRHPNGRGHSQ